MTDPAARIGFMQGRLSPIIDGRIQAFPRDHWKDEFATAAELGIGLMEWTLDQDELRRNPLLTDEGRAEVVRLMAEASVAIPSLTGDCFMQAPLWKAHGKRRESLCADFEFIVEGARETGTRLVVVPVVDNGSIENAQQEQAFVEFFLNVSEWLRGLNMRVAFECEAAPEGVLRLLEPFDPAVFGINYDIGNSASAGFDPREEIAAYGDRILNVHVKDRVLGGTTVPLGQGNADFPAVFKSLANVDYRANYILQTARAPGGDHARVLSEYRDMTQNWITSYGA